MKKINLLLLLVPIFVSGCIGSAKREHECIEFTIGALSKNNIIDGFKIFGSDHDMAVYDLSSRGANIHDVSEVVHVLFEGGFLFSNFTISIRLNPVYGGSKIVRHSRRPHSGAIEYKQFKEYLVENHLASFSAPGEFGQC